MRRVEAGITIAAAPEEVFRFVADLANLPRWQSGIVSARRTSPEPVGVGSTARVVRDLAGQSLTVDLTITEFEPGRRLSLASQASGVSVTATLDVEPTHDGTVARSGIEIKAGSLFMAPLESMIANAAASELASGLERLRDAVEAG
ncbi:MAG TPA: SRPBCC family protein [Candidatus Limnocylindria bacterium]|nr:SRPBCC family protein [Candidatus Limnocylindria bacterium]